METNACSCSSVPRLRLNLSLRELDAKLVSQDIESVGDVVDLMTEAASLIDNDATRKVGCTGCNLCYSAHRATIIHI